MFHGFSLLKRGDIGTRTFHTRGCRLDWNRQGQRVSLTAAEATDENESPSVLSGNAPEVVKACRDSVVVCTSTLLSMYWTSGTSTVLCTF